MRNLRNATRQADLANANQHVERNDERYRFLFEQAAEFILIHNMDGRIVDVNESLCRRLGYARDEMLRMQMEDLVDPDQLSARPLRMNELSEGKCIFSERTYVCKDGTTVEIEANVKKMSDDMVVGVCRDVTERKKIELDLREAELKFRTISEKSLVGIYIYQEDQFVYVNPKFAEIFGYAPEEMTNSISVDAVVDLEDRSRVRDYVKKRLQGQMESIHYEAKGVKKDGGFLYAEVFGNKTTYRGGSAIMGTLIDITERKMAEDQIIKERNLSNEIIDCLPGVFFIQDEQGNYLRWNKLFMANSGYTEEEIKGLNALDFFEGEDKERAKKVIEEIFSSPNGEADFESDVLVRGGEKKPYYFKAKNIHYEGKPCIIGTGIDITQIKKIEAELRQSEANLKTIFDNTDTIYILLDSEIRVISFNQRAQDYAQGEIGKAIKVNDHFSEYVAPSRRGPLELLMGQVKKGEHISYEISFLQKDGSCTWYYVRLIPIAHESSELLGVMAALSNITERKITEQKLQRTLEQLTYHFNNTPLAVIEWDKDGKVIQWSKKAEEVFGWKEEEALGRDMNKHILHPEDAARVTSLVSDLQAGKQVANPHHNRNYTKDGRVLQCEWYNSQLKGSDGNLETILSLVRDVTEIHDAEEGLKRSIKEISDYKIALEESSIVGIADKHGIITYANDNFCRVSGYKKEELIGMDYHLLNSKFHDKEFIDCLWLTIGVGRVWRGEVKNRNKAGKYFWVDMTVVPFLDDDGNPKQFMAISNDITQKKLMEKEILNQKVQEQKKISRALLKGQEKERNKIGQELHDNVNQIIASTRMYLSIALNRKTISRTLIEESAGLIDHAIQEIRLLSKNQITPQVKLGLRELIQPLVDGLNERATIKTTFEYEVTGHSVNTELKLNIYRIIQEQINNILKHARATEVHIELKSEGRLLRVLVSDNGRGFQAEKRRKGIGITNIINRVESFNGELSIDSKPGEGCRLTILLPFH